MSWLRNVRGRRDAPSGQGGQTEQQRGPVEPPKDLYLGALSAAFVNDWAGSLGEAMRPALVAAGVVQAVMVAVECVQRDAQGEPVLGRTVRIVRRGGPPMIGPAVGRVIAANRWHVGALDTVELRSDHPIFHDDQYASPLIPPVIESPRQQIPAANPSQFVPLAASGIRNTAAHLWFALNGDRDLGRLALGVRLEWAGYVLLAEGPPVTEDVLYRAAGAAMRDHRVAEFAIRPVAVGDPLLGDSRVVAPIRRDADSPRSPAIIMGDALPLSAGFDPRPEEIDELRAFVQAEGASRGSLAYVQTRSVLGITVPLPGAHPGRVSGYERRVLESSHPVLLFADGTKRYEGGPERERQLDASLTARLARRTAIRIAVTDLDDPLLDAEGYSIRLV